MVLITQWCARSGAATPVTDGDWENVVTGGSGNGHTGSRQQRILPHVHAGESRTDLRHHLDEYQTRSLEHAAEIWCSESGDLRQLDTLLGTNDGFGDDANGGFISTETFDEVLSTLVRCNGKTGGELWRSDDQWRHLDPGEHGWIRRYRQFNHIRSGSLRRLVVCASLHHGMDAGSEVWRCQAVFQDRLGTGGR